MYSTCGRMPPWMDFPDSVYVRAAVVANNDLWREALGADQTGKPVQKRRRIGGYGAGLSRHQKPELGLRQNTAVLMDHVVFLGLALQAEPVRGAVVGPDAPFFPMADTGQIFPDAAVIGIVKVDAADVVYTIRTCMRIRMQKRGKPVLQNGQSTLTAGVFQFVAESVRCFHWRYASYVPPLWRKGQKNRAFTRKSCRLSRGAEENRRILHKNHGYYTIGSRRGQAWTRRKERIGRNDFVNL